MEGRRGGGEREGWVGRARGRGLDASSLGRGPGRARMLRIRRVGEEEGRRGRGGVAAGWVRAGAFEREAGVWCSREVAEVPAGKFGGGRSKGGSQEGCRSRGRQEVRLLQWQP